jgi:hypothetical protein
MMRGLTLLALVAALGLSACGGGNATPNPASPKQRAAPSVATPTIVTRHGQHFVVMGGSSSSDKRLADQQCDQLDDGSRRDQVNFVLPNHEVYSICVLAKVGP